MGLISRVSSRTYRTMTKSDPFCVGKPDLKIDQVQAFVHNLFNLTVTNVKALESYDDQNFRCEDAVSGKLYVFKILNHEYTRTEEEVHLTVSRVANYLNENQLPTQRTYHTKTLDVKTVGGENLPCLVRILDYLPGDTLSSIMPL